MLYPKNKSEKLDKKLFVNPTSEYRGTPFWAWNCELDKDMLLRQIEYLKEMGLGGFHMHSRTGMATEYLSEEFFDLVKACVEKARSEEMIAWLYDEDRWPSGAAGGLVTKNPEYSARHLLFTPKAYAHTEDAIPHIDSTSVGSRMENGKLLAKYDIDLDSRGYLQAYRRLKEDEEGKNTWYAYLETAGKSPWFNNETYVDTLNKEAMDKFIEITYEAYKKHVGKDFGGIIPAIFTDEPQFTRKKALGYASEKKDIFLPWTDDLEDSFTESYGFSLLDRLPELIWELPAGEVSRTRYFYHDHVTERFTVAFADNCGKWCRENSIMLTGHMMEESTLLSQTAALGEAMRAYRGFDLPGIDMLCDWREYTTAKQAQSAVHQYGHPGVLSELYGVTNWDFDFRGHKLQGDWQAALGVTVRVHHLSWVSMKGEAKRDYPASINYQAPWYKEYSYIEDHFARLNTALTRGKPLIKIGVIHPVESYWINWGPFEQTKAVREQLDKNFSSLTDWLIFGQLDFNFISESLFPEQCEKASNPLAVGQMEYETIIVPDCITLRQTTVDRLKDFAAAGGNLIIMGKQAELIDALPHGEKTLFPAARIIPFEKNDLYSTLEEVRILEIKEADGAISNNYVTQLRQDGENRWLFIANGREAFNKDLASPKKIRINIKGEWTLTLYDTLTGEIKVQPAFVENDYTNLELLIYTHDSLLFKLSPGLSQENLNKTVTLSRPIGLHQEGKIAGVPVELTEPNVLLLDMAEYAFDGGDFHENEEILRIDNIFRAKLGLPPRMSSFAQPWVTEKVQPENEITLRYRFMSEINLDMVQLALEDADQAKVQFNGFEVDVQSKGYYVDESIEKIDLGSLKKGENVLDITLPFGIQSNLESCYILGDFGVDVKGYEKTITKPVKTLAFGDITRQGLPFYGGNIKYHLEVETRGGDLHIRVPQYRGHLITLDVNDERAGYLVFDPYTLTVPGLKAGKHRLTLTLYGNRVNTFGTVHNSNSSTFWFGPDAWRTVGDAFSYEYVLKPVGILKSPVIITE